MIHSCFQLQPNLLRADLPGPSYGYGWLLLSNEQVIFQKHDICCIFHIRYIFHVFNTFHIYHIIIFATYLSYNICHNLEAVRWAILDFHSHQQSYRSWSKTHNKMSCSESKLSIQQTYLFKSMIIRTIQENYCLFFLKRS